MISHKSCIFMICRFNQDEILICVNVRLRAVASCPVVRPPSFPTLERLQQTARPCSAPRCGWRSASCGSPPAPTTAQTQLWSIASRYRGDPYITSPAFGVEARMKVPYGARFYTCAHRRVQPEARVTFSFSRRFLCDWKNRPCFFPS
jgi:hypothetical protein